MELTVGKVMFYGGIVGAGAGFILLFLLIRIYTHQKDEIKKRLSK